MRRLQRSDGAEREIARPPRPSCGRGQKNVEYGSVPDVVRGYRTISAEVSGVLRKRRKGRVGVVIDGLRVGVAETVREDLARALLNVQQETVELGIEVGRIFEINRVLGVAFAGKESCQIRIARAAKLTASTGEPVGEIDILVGGGALGIVTQGPSPRIGVGYVIEISQ